MGRGQTTRMTPKPAYLSPNFHITPGGSRFPRRHTGVTTFCCFFIGTPDIYLAASVIFLDISFSRQTPSSFSLQQTCAANPGQNKFDDKECTDQPKQLCIKLTHLSEATMGRSCSKLALQAHCKYKTSTNTRIGLS
ncbi:hypothetical protein AVEN_272009-1 [Araneus ventricosus]|uniref:Uncharacterized protein n=1 Tax=Araneus ventricosus TaxID=182803 RepID=A0A4Y2IZV8_ARAVE|nr:hypothetical protein AVEN_272009-1 [Araneus ventricosus]